MAPTPDKAKICDDVSSSKKKRKAAPCVRQFPDFDHEHLKAERKKRTKHWGPFTKEQTREAIQDLSYDVQFLKPKLVQRTSIWNKDRDCMEEVRHALDDTNHRIDRLCAALNEVRDIMKLERISYSPETPAARKDFVEYP